jgi:hypothetical protein
VTAFLARVLLVLVAAGEVFAQAAFELDADAAELELVERIAQVEADAGPMSADLIGPLRALGLLHEESGNDALAEVAVERARELVRANYGLHSLEQVPLIEQRIAIARNRGDTFETWNLEQSLLVLAGRNPRDERSIGIYRRIGDERLRVLEQYFAGELPAEVFFGCYYDTGYREPVAVTRSNSVFGECVAGRRSVVIRSILWEVQMHYSDAIRAALANELYASEEIRALERALVRINFLYGSIYLDGRDYALGRESLRRLTAYEAASGASPEAATGLLVEIADWDLLFARSGKLREAALETYQLALGRLRQSGSTQAEIVAIFAPETPVVLPAFLPNPLRTEPTDATTGFIDVAFDVTREGRGRRVEILDTSENSTRADERRLRQLVARSRFRPRLVDGQLADSDTVTLRYYLQAETPNEVSP